MRLIEEESLEAEGEEDGEVAHHDHWKRQGGGRKGGREGGTYHRFCG